MTIFLDTSAIFALMDADDRAHRKAARFFEGLVGARRLVTHNYVTVEAMALVHSRLGHTSIRRLEDLLLPVEVAWVTPEIHQSALAAYVAAERRRVSLVDWVSFRIMTARGIDTAFAFDTDFKAQGFTLAP